MQGAYVSKLMELAQSDNRVCHMLADSGTNYDEIFRMNFPNQIFNFGIAEQNAVGIAAGMAAGGKIPFLFVQGAFIVYRAMEFMRNDVCFQNLNVKLVGQGSGTAWTTLGPSHHTTEDLAILRAMPNMNVFSAATPLQVKACVEAMYHVQGPCYLRIGMSDEKEFFDENYKLPTCGYDIWEKEGDVVVFSTGSILEEAMEAVQMLEKQGIMASLINVAQMKPFCKNIVISKCSNAKLVATIEEHQVVGGLGGLIAETMTEHGIAAPLVRIGLENCFASGYSPSQKQIRLENSLDALSIAEKIQKVYRQ